MKPDNECSVHGPFYGQVCVSCAKYTPDNECNLHGPFHGMVCTICFDVAKGASILAGNPPDVVDNTLVGTLEREIERRDAEICQLREALELVVCDFEMRSPMDIQCEKDAERSKICLAALASTGPCPHEEELKRLRDMNNALNRSYLLDKIVLLENENKELSHRAEVAKEESDDEWRIKATESFSNGTCPICFCSDGGPHVKGCEWYEIEYRNRILEKSSELNANVAVSAIDRAADKESYIFVLESAISEVCADEITEPKWARERLLAALAKRRGDG